MYVMVNNSKPVVEIREVLKDGTKISDVCGSLSYQSGNEDSIKIDAYHPENYLKYWYLKYKIGVKGSEGVISGEQISALDDEILGKK